MTFKDLQKLIQSQAGPIDNQQLRRLQGKPFWVWDRAEHRQTDITNKGKCCFNHIIGLPTKDGVQKPIFDYERMLYKALLELPFQTANAQNMTVPTGNATTADNATGTTGAENATGVGGISSRSSGDPDLAVGNVGIDLAK